MKLLREPVKDSTKGETQLIANPSYPRSALSLHFAMYAGRPPLKDSISRGLAGIFTPKYQESARGGKADLQVFELGGQNPNAPDDTTLGGAVIVGTAKVRKVRGYHIFAAPNPGTTVIDTRQKGAAVCDPGPLRIFDRGDLGATRR